MRVFIGLSLLLFGCGEMPSEPVTIPVDASRPLALGEVPSLDMDGHRAPSIGRAAERPTLESRQRRLEEMRTAMPLMVDLNARLNDATDWRMAEAAVDDLLPQIPESMRRSAEADASERILRMIVRQDSRAPEDWDALGEYTRRLIELQSPEGDDILKALILLDERWDPAMIASTARSAARQLGYAFTAQAECVGCTVEEALGAMLPQKRMSMDPFLYEVQTVHRELMRRAQVGSR